VVDVDDEGGVVVLGVVEEDELLYPQAPKISMEERMTNDKTKNLSCFIMPPCII
jgi:hypothetical protein